MPIVGFVSGRSADASLREVAAFREGFNETGYVEGQNATIEYHWLEGQYVLRSGSPTPSWEPAPTHALGIMRPPMSALPPKADK